MLYIVDGTGSDILPLRRDYERYDKEMHLGMCDRMRIKFDGVYYRGPSFLGLETFRTAETVYEEIKKDPALHEQPLFLAGHSRGGAAVISVANLLKRDAIEVDGMFLFDAVDRTASRSKSVETIPRNVKLVAHALRDKTLAFLFDSAATDAKNRFFECNERNRGRGCEEERRVAETYIKFDDAMKVRSRVGGSGFSHGIDFGNCGTAYEGEQEKFNKEIFPGSHGAIGGSPIWINDYDAERLTNEDGYRYRNIITNDRMAMKLVWDWMSKFFEKTKLALHGGVSTPIQQPPTYPWSKQPRAPR
jgi:hypothetical protein